MLYVAFLIFLIPFVIYVLQAIVFYKSGYTSAPYIVELTKDKNPNIEAFDLKNFLTDLTMFSIDNIALPLLYNLIAPLLKVVSLFIASPMLNDFLQAGSLWLALVSWPFMLFLVATETKIIK